MKSLDFRGAWLTPLLTRAALLTVTMLLGLLLASGVALVEVQRQAEAAFPGENGKIAYVTRREIADEEQSNGIYIMNPDGTYLSSPFRKGGEEHSFDYPAWSPDGTKITYAGWSNYCDGSRTNITIAGLSSSDDDSWVAEDTDARDPDACQYHTGYQVREPAWAPSGTKLAYTRSSSELRTSEIYVANTDGTNKTSLTGEGSYDSEPDWAPGGARIAFRSRSGQDPTTYNGDIYKMNPDGTDRVRLTAGLADDRMPDYSPKGAKIAFTRDRDVYTMNTDGSALTRLTTEGGEQPSWSPDGTKIAFSSDRDGGYSEIYVMDADGSNETNITNNPAFPDSNPDWQPATSDTTPPETSIDSGPQGYKNLTQYRFTFSSSEASNHGFECRLDDASFYRGCGSPSYYYDLPDGRHTFRVRAIDAFFNIDPTPASRSWFVDTAKPSGTVLINDGRTSTASRTVTLKLSATDPSPASGVASMRFRNENTTTWSAWQSYATSKSWTLSSGGGTKTVYVQYRDRAKNISDVASDAITYRP